MTPGCASAARSRKHRESDAQEPQQSVERRAGPRHGPVISGGPEMDPTARRVTGAALPHQRLSALCSPRFFISNELGIVRARERRGKGGRMSRRMTRRATKEVTIDPEAWARNLRAPPDATHDGRADMRRINNYLAFWAICPQGACRRAKRCAGDAQACFDFIFPQLPERMKAQFRAELKAAHAGGTPEEVKRKIREELARFDEMAAGLTSPLSGVG
jgi:hypothetical protein